VQPEFRPFAGALTQTPMGVGVILRAGIWPYPGFGIPMGESDQAELQWEVLVAGATMRFYGNQLEDPRR